MTGHLGIQAPAGLKVDIHEVEGAETLTLRDLPPELVDLTTSPLLVGFRFTAPPTISATMTRHRQVELTSTLIDDMQASTVVIEDGTRITKLKLRVRNNTRQYLTLTLPPAAKLTHSLVDGNPVRPALGEAGPNEELVLLFPLKQSERIGAGRARYHVVQSGETLSDISNYYYSTPGAYRRLVEANPDLYGGSEISTGQRLRIPAEQGATVQESSFVIELAYKEAGEPLGTLGWESLHLPKVDIDTVKVTWHVYFPQALMPLHFGANLTQYSSIRYDPFRRLLQFFERARWIDHAWAGGGRYKSILSQRRAIYRAEAKRAKSSRAVLASFPLVGERYRFKRILLGQDQPEITISYVARGVAPPVRWLALLLALGVTLFLLLGERRRRDWLVAGAVLVGLLVVAHFVLGVHRRIVWGIDLGLLIAWGRLALRPSLSNAVAWLERPWTWTASLTLRNLLVVIGLLVVVQLLLAYPLLLSSAGMVVLFFAWRRALRRGSAARGEVAHA